jgi:hypothetical protein
MEQVNLPFLLSKYFTIKGSVVIPGVGSINRKYISACISERQNIEAPTCLFMFDKDSDSPSIHQLSYLSGKSGFSLDEVVHTLKELGNEILSYLQKEGKLEWTGIGIFQTDEDGVVSFQAKTISTRYFEPRGSRVVEKPSSFTAEDNRDIIIETEEATEKIEETVTYTPLEEPETVENTSNKFALLIILICLALLSFRFFMGQFDPLGPTFQKLNPPPPPATFQKF